MCSQKLAHSIMGLKQNKNNILIHPKGINTTISHLDILNHLITKQRQVEIQKHNRIQICLQVTS
jgi:hypothetical protein